KEYQPTVYETSKPPRNSSSLYFLLAFGLNFALSFHPSKKSARLAGQVATPAQRLQCAITVTSVQGATSCVSPVALYPLPLAKGAPQLPRLQPAFAETVN